jgi:hypothetical protein
MPCLVQAKNKSTMPEKKKTQQASPTQKLVAFYFFLHFFKSLFYGTA